MTLVVLKFGGTSLANTKLMNNAVVKVVQEVKAGKRVVVVVSAMAGVTDHLVNLVNEISDSKAYDNLAEYASIITTGEQVSAGMFALLLQQAGLRARSWLGFQAGIITDDKVADGNIIELRCEKISKSLEQEYQVAVVAGFQGVTLDNRISTLGRGGSDTSAIILAGVLNADRCDIYTDVEGVFTADPRIVAKARKLDHINYDAMLAFASSGAKVLQAKSVEWAKHYQVKVQVLSSFTANIGTMVSKEAISYPVIGIAISSDISSEYASSNLDLAKLSIIGANIENNDKLIKYMQKVLDKANIEVLYTVIKSKMIIAFIIKDEQKFNAIRLLHNMCKLEERLLNQENF